jgi:hypothetical protein
VVIRDFDFMGAVSFPFKADAVLVIDSDAVLSFTISVKCLQAVGRGRVEVGEDLRCMDHQQLPPRNGSNVIPPAV